MKRKLNVTEKEFSPMYFTSSAEKAVTKKNAQLPLIQGPHKNGKSPNS